MPSRIHAERSDDFSSSEVSDRPFTSGLYIKDEHAADASFENWSQTEWKYILEGEWQYVTEESAY